jgi:cytochrome c oxidase subunit 6b
MADEIVEKYEQDVKAGTQSAVPFATAGFNRFFTTTQQTKYCWAAFVEAHKCAVDKKDPQNPTCVRLRKNYDGLCPKDWVQRNEISFSQN